MSTLKYTTRVEACCSSTLKRLSETRQSLNVRQLPSKVSREIIAKEAKRFGLPYLYIEKIINQS